MQINKALTNLIRSQSLRSVAEERNRGAILFDDGATMQVNAVGHCIQKRVRTRMQALGVNQLDAPVTPARQAPQIKAPRTK